MGGRRLYWLPTALAAFAFISFLLAFGWELFAYQHKVVEWAKRDLQSRADLAAANLDEPLRTQDFRKIHALGDRCHAEGVRLQIFGHEGGRMFDSWRQSKQEPPSFCARAECGDYTVSIGIPSSRVYAPFHLAVVGFCLAGLVGMAGVLLFFFVTYRQRVHIRELKRLESFRREFIADVSHEIKTPLTGILGAVDMLEGDSPLIPLIRKSSLRLNALVQSILDLARLEREGEGVVCALTNVSELAHDTVEGLLPMAASAGVTLRFSDRTARPMACMASVDAQRIGQALANLVVNAIRHSGSRDVAVSLENDEKEIRLAVEDHGVGIPAEHAERVFERFHRVDPSRAEETGGAGLGLAIVRRIVRLHGGDATLSAVEPHGCRFVMRLPTSSPS